MTQPAATIIAGSLAVVAAAIAFIGLLVNLHHQHRAERRSRAIDQITEAVAAVETLAAVLGWLPKAEPGSDSTKRANQKAIDTIERVQIATARLEVFGLDKAAEATRAYTLAAVAAGGSKSNPPSEADNARAASRAHAVDLLRDARRQLEMGATRTAYEKTRRWIKHQRLDRA
ncbi:hypothetical protein [Nocardia cyriacigeorgica]|uniref:Uncharacterized protein n=1 Tax=Nocardia cyriacigeorgica TaxID=135487 RepID=A0A5R8NZF1_9NOCA|nr:hypothetical protein [Nocardia cyriacigeorgica]TLF82319.1 hypothetical protein FEK34_00785 [Nocardia cyriacigeorgica]